MEDYNKIIEALGVRYVLARNLVLQRPCCVRNSYDVGNTLVLVHHGQLAFGNDEQVVGPGELLFLPGGRASRICYGTSTDGTAPPELLNDEMIGAKSYYFRSNNDPEKVGQQPESHSYVSFEAKVFDSVNFFASLNIPPFKIPAHPRLAELVQLLVAESLAERPGRDRLLTTYTDNIAVEVVRYILQRNMFVEQMATNSTYFKDPRLIDLFNYIKENLDGDLANKVLSGVANVSEDYVGQYFKMLTGINPQDYIEYQRMERAVLLLRTTKKSIHEIGKEVGYKDTAYFCRRFKMMFGIPAGRMRRRESSIGASV